MTDPTPPSESPPKKKKHWTRWIWRSLLALLLVVLLGAGLVYSLVWMPSAQQKLLHRFTAKLSKDWNVVFRIDSVAMESWSHVRFYGFYLEDPNRDTLLQASVIDMQGWDIQALLEKRIDIEKATVQHTVFKVQRQPEQRYFSLDFIIDYFHAAEPLPPEERYRFRIDTAVVQNVRYVYADATTGTTLRIWAPSVYTHAYDIDLIAKRAHLDTAFLAQARVYIQNEQPIAIPDDVPPSPYNTLPTGEAPPWSLRCTHLVFDNLTYRSTETFAQQAAHYQAVQQDKKGRGEQAKRLRRKGKPQPKKTLAQKNQQLAQHNHRDNRDLNNLHFQQINLRVRNASLENEHYKGNLRELSARTPNGFNFVDIRTEFEVTPTRAVFKNLRLRTENSSIGNAVVLHYDNYGALGEFSDAVEVAINLEDAHFVLDDIAAFMPEINDHILAKLYKKTVVNVRGTFQGYLKHFNLDNFDIELGKKDIVMDQERAEKKTPVEWLARTFGPKPKRKAERQRKRAERKKERRKRN